MQMIGYDLSPSQTEVIKKVFIRNMWKYIPHEFCLYLPKDWGGFGLYPIKWDLIPQPVQALIRIREYSRPGDVEAAVNARIANRILNSYGRKHLTERGVN